MNPFQSHRKIFVDKKLFKVLPFMQKNGIEKSTFCHYFNPSAKNEC